MADDRAIAYLEDGVVVIRASALGDCSRNLWGALTGIEPVAPPPFLSRAAEEGNLHEVALRSKIIEDGWDFDDAQVEVELVAIPGKLVIRGHLDGIIEKDGLRAGWEAKSMSRAVFAEWERKGWESKPNYAWQLSVYMAATGLPFQYVVKRRDDGHTEITMIDTPPFTLEQVKAKAMAVYKAYKSGEMPACDPERFPCERFFIHDEDDMDDVDEGEPWMAQVAAEYVELGDDIKALEDQRKELAEVLRKGVGRDAAVQVGGWRVSNKVMTRTTLDRKRLTADLGDAVVAGYEITTEYTRLDVRRKG